MVKAASGGGGRVPGIGEQAFLQARALPSVREGDAGMAQHVAAGHTVKAAEAVDIDRQGGARRQGLFAPQARAAAAKIGDDAGDLLARDRVKQGAGQANRSPLFRTPVVNAVGIRHAHPRRPSAALPTSLARRA